MRRSYRSFGEEQEGAAMSGPLSKAHRVTSHSAADHLYVLKHGNLLYYKSESDATPRSVLAMEGCSVQRFFRQDGQSHGFVLTHKDRAHVFLAPDADVALRWFSTIKASAHPPNTPRASFSECAHLGFCYRATRKLGTSGVSVVRHGVCVRDKSEWALKLVLRSCCVRPDALVRCCARLTQLAHENVACLREVVQLPKHVVLVCEVLGTPLLPGLSQLPHYNENDARRVMACLVQGVSFLHSHDVCHCNIKPENLLFTDAEVVGDDWLVKITDAALSSVFDPQQTLWYLRGPPDYTAPELLQQRPPSKAADIWSCGVVLYTLLSGTSPFRGVTDADVREAVLRGEYDFPELSWAGIRAGRELVCSMLCVDPAQRPTAEEVLEHPWFTPQSSPLPLPRARLHFATHAALRRARGAVLSVAASVRVGCVVEAGGERRRKGKRK